MRHLRMRIPELYDDFRSSERTAGCTIAHRNSSDSRRSAPRVVLLLVSCPEYALQALFLFRYLGPWCSTDLSHQPRRCTVQLDGWAVSCGRWGARHTPALQQSRSSAAPAVATSSRCTRAGREIRLASTRCACIRLGRVGGFTPSPALTLQSWDAFFRSATAGASPGAAHTTPPSPLVTTAPAAADPSVIADHLSVQVPSPPALTFLPV